MINDLKQFIDVAERDRKYAPNTARGMLAALSVFEPELNDQEKESLAAFKDNLNSIYMSVYRNNQKTHSSSTLAEYKRRITKLIDHFEQFGNDPIKMASWVTAPRVKIKKQDKKTSIKNQSDEKIDEELPPIQGVSMNRFELTRPNSNVKSIILTPSDLNKHESEKLKKYLDVITVIE